MRSLNDSFAETLDENETVVGGITVTKVIKEHRSIIARQGEETTIGELVDRQLAQIAVNGEVIQEVTLGVNPEYWETTLGRFYSERVAPNFNIPFSAKRRNKTMPN